MRDALRGAVARAGWRLDATLALALAIGCIGAVELLTATGQERSLAVWFALALAVTCAAILLRSRDPLLAAVLTGAVWFVPGVVLGPRWADAMPSSAALAIVVLAYTLGVREPRLRGLIGLAVLVLGMSAGDFSDPVPPFMFTVPAWIAGEAVQARSRLAAQLAARARELEEEREAFAREAVRYERTRIARELHDIVAHSLSMMVVQAGAGQRQLDSNPAQAAQSLEHVGGAARQAELELGQLLDLLGAQAPRRSDGGLRLIDELVRQAGASGLPVACRFRGAHDALPLELSEVAYRVAQEGLTNALKHAPGAPVQVTVDAGEGEGDVVITVENAPPRRAASELQSTGGQHGIRGMRERVRDCGGTLEAGPTADGGWRVTAYLPYVGPMQSRAPAASAPIQLESSA
ncbi:MAG TPA: histidine kinase [Solirubrobacteraceae bacterium]|jgi:signal transduction histidine kinase